MTKKLKAHMIRGIPHHLPNMVAVTLWYGMVASEAGYLVFLDDVNTD